MQQSGPPTASQAGRAQRLTRNQSSAPPAAQQKKLTAGQKTANQIIAAARAPVEHGFAALKNWRILTRLRLNPTRATNLLRALLVLTNLETTR